MRRLAFKLPTALQVDHSFAILFHEGGVSEFTYLNARQRYLTLDPQSNSGRNRIWALVDSSPTFPQPANIFIRSSPFFIVEAVSPRSDHLEWLKRNHYNKFHMKPWSASEVLQAYVDQASNGLQCSHFLQPPVPPS